MTNYEHYKKRIEKFTRVGLRIAIDKDTNEICTCNGFACHRCKFGSSSVCGEKTLKWADAEYIEPSVKWSKVPVDTPILVRRDIVDDEWHKMHFAKYDNDHVYVWANGQTSYTGDKTEWWFYAKLAEVDNGI